jgi:hypothetical protein
MLRYGLAICLLAVALSGCGKGVDDAGRVPAGAPDTSNPSNVNLGGGIAPGAPAAAKTGPSEAPGSAPAPK